MDKRIERLYQILESCELCPRKCRKNRLIGEKGVCKAGVDLYVSSYNAHFGEEEPLVGRSSGLYILDRFGTRRTGGSGTIFLTSCNLLCVYCQNFEISHLWQGRRVPVDVCADMMLELQRIGCHNINFVTPTHFAPQLIKALRIAIDKGLKIPIVWNCGGYENVEIIKLLDGIVDIYMPDFKYGDSEPAKKYSDVSDYFERCCEAIKEMHRQVGDLRMNKKGIAYRGLLIRHLVLPNDLAGSEKVLKFIAEEISTNSYVNIMAQYRPEGNAYKFPELNRHIYKNEFLKVIEIAKKLGLTCGLEEKQLNI